eukprot:Gb_36372 [translate_table: standard]
MASSTTSAQSRGENGAQLLQELELLSHALSQRKDEKRKNIPGRRGGLLPGGGHASQVPGRNVTLNYTLSDFLLPNVGYRHSISSAIPESFEQFEKGVSRRRMSSARGRHAVRSIDFDKNSDPKALGFHSSPRLQHSRSSVEYKNTPNIDNFPEWLEDNLNFSRRIEAPIDKKRLWNWKPLRALAHIRQQQFSCIFLMRVHSIEGLPQSMNGLHVSVQWRRRGGGGQQTMPIQVSQGVAEFEETLHHSCTIYGNKSPGQGMRYKSKLFTLSVIALDTEGLDFGKHRLDLSKFLPESLVNTREDANPGSWPTSFKLTGKARGGTLSVTFWYKILNKEPWQIKHKHSSYIKKTNHTSRQSFGRRPNSTPGTPQFQPLEAPLSPSISEPGADLDYISHLSLHDLSSSVDEIPTKTSLYIQESEGMQRRSLASLFEFEPKLKFPPSSNAVVESIDLSSRSLCKDVKKDCRLEDLVEFTVVEKGVEVGNSNISQSMEYNIRQEKYDAQSSRPEENVGKIEQCIIDSQVQQSDTFVPPLEEDVHAEELLESGQDHQERDGNLGKACNTEDEIDLVEGVFLSMLELDDNSFALSSDCDPDSPRGCLFKKFEKESSLGGGSIGLGFSIPSVLSFTETSSHSWDSDEDFELASMVQAAESELQKATQAMRSKTRAKILEDAEAEALMQKWGLNEKAFQNSPPDSSGGFGSPINLPLPGPIEQPPLAEGLGSVIKMKDGGLLRSMSPALFQKSKIEGRLIMQVSKPLVVPAKMGLSVMDILDNLSSLGIEKLSVQARAMMPLEDITGKTIQQVALEAGPVLEVSKSRQAYHQCPEVDLGSDDRLSIGKGVGIPEHKSVKLDTLGLQMSYIGDTYEEYVALEEVAPLAMEKIEAMAIEGLKIQSDMEDQDAPSNICAMWAGETAALDGMGARKSVSLGPEGTSGLQLLDAKESNSNVDGLMALAITFDEWLQLDAGMVDEGTSERTSKILAAHHAACSKSIVGQHHKDDKGKQDENKHGIGKCGFMGNTLTIALLVQLHDPLRNYEPVGAPMMALIQAERMVLPPAPKIWRRVTEKGKSEVIEEMEERKQEPPQFKITDVHVTGLKLQESNKLKSWSNPKQQQSGSRWLIANGMGKSGKHTPQKLKPVPKSMSPSQMKVKPGDTLWSISACVHGSGGKWKDIAALNPHIRNPDIIFPNETIKLR